MREPFYGFLSNRVTTALVSPLGILEWLPWPRFDSDAAFCRLLDPRHGGFFSTLPRGRIVEAHQHYRDGTLILETSVRSAAGHANWIDFLPLGRDIFVRRLHSAIPLQLVCRPTFVFGSRRASVVPRQNGALFYSPEGREGLVLEIAGAARPSPELDVWEIGPGVVDVVIRYAEDRAGDRAVPLGSVDAMEAATTRYWQEQRVSYDGPWSEWFNQSMRVIRALTYRNNGALVAAATTSLPEIIGEERQWDYRYVWVRDGAYGAEALLLAGDTASCRQFLEFIFNVTDLVDKPYPSPFVRVDGTLAHGERELRWMAGHRGSRPVRVGNAASRQLQLDVEGEILWVVWRYWRMTGDRSFVRDYWGAIQSVAEWILAGWHQADASLWEFRGFTDEFVHSRVLCWVGLAAAERLAEEVLNRPDLAMRWQQGRLQVERSVWELKEASGLGRFPQSRRSSQTDAALLTLPLYGFVDVNHPTFQRTLEAIETELVHDGLVFRYRQDNLGPALHPFTLAGFWLARVYLLRGDLARAEAIFARQLEVATDLKLFAEHVDVQSGEPRGNFPQLFPHVGLVTTLSDRRRLVAGDRLLEPLVR